MKILKMTLAILPISFISCKKYNCVQNIPEKCNVIDISPEYNPVCGCNGKTYWNSGDAECSGVIEFIKGECR